MTARIASTPLAPCQQDGLPSLGRLALAGKIVVPLRRATAPVTEQDGRDPDMLRVLDRQMRGEAVTQEMPMAASAQFGVSKPWTGTGIERRTA